MSQHKIQSSTGLTLELAQVPKLLGLVSSCWAPHALVVSFKLETDPAILLEKAYRAIENYSVHLVVANLLQTRREECVLVSKASPSTSAGEAYERLVVQRASDPHLEAKLIFAIEQFHVKHMLKEYGVLSADRSKEQQAAAEAEVLHMLGVALEDPVTMQVQAYAEAADKAWEGLAADKDYAPAMEKDEGIQLIECTFGGCLLTTLAIALVAAVVWRRSVC